MKKSLSILFVCAAAVLAVSCAKEPQYPAQPDWSQFPDPSEEPDDGLLKPEPCTFNVVAHRGGSSEAGLPDNSIASLKYAMELGCYASECDIYWTKDDDVIVAHADGECKINGLHPWEATVAEIRAAGTLSNGEQVPTLSEFIDVVCVKGSCTRLWPDIKNITSPSTLTQYPILATKRAVEIITEKGAKHFVEFICTGNSTVMKSAYAYANNAGIAIGWMSNQSAIAYAQNGYPWANLSAKSYMNPEAGGEGARSLEEFQLQDIALSVFNVDKKAGDGSAVYSEKAIQYYTDNYKSFKALCTNYPKWLIETLTEATKTYDGINSEDELFAFAAEMSKDPEAKRFQNADGEVVLHKDITVAKAWTPIEGFNGTLNGNGKKIVFNSSTDGTKIGMFGTLKGVVKNLEVAGKFESTNNADEILIGALAAEVDGGQISGCTSSATVSVAATGESAKHIALMGGIAGKVSNGAYIVNTKYTGALSISSETVYYNVGGIVGVSAQDDQLITLKNCEFTGSIVIDSKNQNTDWAYMGGIFGKPQTKSQYLLPTYHIVLDGCKSSGTVNVKASSKLRFGGIVGYIKACTKVISCEVSSAMTMNSVGNYDRACGGVIGFQETSSDSYVKDCIFSGSLVSPSESLGNNYFGGITTTGMSTKTIIEGCKTTSAAVVDITGAKGKSVGMICGRPNTAVTVKNCKIAGKLVKADGTATVISATNLEDWMFKGSATTASVVLENNGYNAE